MKSEYYLLTTYWVIFVAVMVSLAMVWLYKVANASKVAQLTVASAFAGLVIFMHWGFGGENFLSKTISGEKFFLIILAGALAVNSLLYATSWNIFKNLSQDRILLVQGLRVFVGGGFLMEGVVGVIPGWFSIMDGYMHIASGFFALFAALVYLNNKCIKNKLIILANLIGITDILVIVTSICFVVWSDIGPHHNMQYIVFGGGPVFLWLHFVSIMKVIYGERPQATG